MQNISPFFSSPRSGSYHSVSSTPERENALLRPDPAPFSHQIRMVSSSPLPVHRHIATQVRQPTGGGMTRKTVWLMGLAVLGGAAFACGFIRGRAGMTERSGNDTLMQSNFLPSPVALRAAIGSDPYNSATQGIITGDEVRVTGSLDPYRGHFPHGGDGMDAVTLQKVNKEIVRFLKKKGFLAGVKKPAKFSMEEISAAVANYLGAEKTLGEKNIARLILKTSERYGGDENDSFSSAQAASAVGKWFFSNMLGSSPEMMIAEILSKDNYPYMFTIDSLKYLLSPEGLQAEGKVVFTTLPESDQATLKNLWNKVVQNNIPLIFYYANDPQLKGMSLDDIEFGSLFTGSLFLYEFGENLGKTDPKAVMAFGAALLDMALRDGVDVNMLKYYSLPALFFQAINFPERLTAEIRDNQSLFRATALDEYLAHRKRVINALEDLDAKVNRYQEAVKQWLTRGWLADSIIERCPNDAIFPLVSSADAIMTKEQKFIEGRKQAKEKYLNNMGKPCKTAPDSIDDEYTKQTKNVADRFAEVDEFLINSALGAVEKKERDFILSEQAVIHSLKIIPFIKANGIFPAMRDNGADRYDFDKFKGADAFSVTIDGERRCYALKGKADHGYDVIRFDQALPHDDRVEYNNLHPLIAYSGGEPEKSLIKNNNQKNDKLVIFLTNSHRETLYNTLHMSGDTASDLQKIWGLVKHILPFYDCIEGAIKRDLEQAVPACLMDAVSFFYAGVKLAGISNKFGASFIKGLNKGTLVFAGNTLNKNTLNAAGAQFFHHLRLPAVKDVSSVAKSALRAADPGFELLAFAGRKSLAKIIKYLEKHGGEKQFDGLIAKLKSAELQNLLPSSITLDESLTLARVELQNTAKNIGQTGGTKAVAGAASDIGENLGQKIQHLEEGKRLSSPVSEETVLDLPITNAGQGQGSQSIKYMFNNNPGHSSQSLGHINQLVNVNRIPNRTAFIRPMDYYYAIFYPNKFDHTNDIINSIKRHYASPTIYQHSYGEDILTIPKQFSYLRNHINVLTNEVNKAHAYADLVKNKFARTTMMLPNGMMQYPEKNVIKSYLSGALHTTDPHIIQQAMNRLKYHTEKIVEYFEKSKKSIIFATCSTPARPYAYRAACPMGFTYPDDLHRRVVIMVDNFDSAPILSTQPHLTVLHEVSHHSGSLDFLISPSTSRVGDASEFMEAFDDALHLRGTDTISIDDEFARVYNLCHVGAALSKQQISQLLIKDPMLKANTFMDNADFVAKMISDIAQKKRFNHDYATPRNKREAALSLEKIRLNAMVSFIYKTAMKSIYNSEPDAT